MLLAPRFHKPSVLNISIGGMQQPCHHTKLCIAVERHSEKKPPFALGEPADATDHLRVRPQRRRGALPQPRCMGPHEDWAHSNTSFVAVMGDMKGMVEPWPRWPGEEGRLREKKLLYHIS